MVSVALLPKVCLPPRRCAHVAKLAPPEFHHSLSDVILCSISLSTRR